MGLKPISVKALVGNTRFHKEIDRHSIFGTERVVRKVSNKRCEKNDRKTLENANKFSTATSESTTTQKKASVKETEIEAETPILLEDFPFPMTQKERFLLIQDLK